jgi:hypothetical protein
MGECSGQFHGSDRQCGDDKHDERGQDRQPKKQIAEIRIALALFAPAFPQLLDLRIIKVVAVGALRGLLRVPLAAALADLALADPDGQQGGNIHAGIGSLDFRAM